MTLGTVIAILFFLFFLTALVSWLVLYIQFCHSIEKQWATQVLTLLHDAERCVSLEYRQLQELKQKRELKTHSLEEEAFTEHLTDYSVDELESFPGIGPGTVSKLRAAGFDTLAALHGAQISIHGLGEKRLADIDYAIRKLLHKARSAFDKGDCRQAQVLADQLGALSVHYDGLEKRTFTRARAAEEFIRRLQKTVEYARQVSFWRWFRPISNEVLVPSEVMDADLPSLERALRAAEHGIARSEDAKRTRKPDETVPALRISPPRRIEPHAQTQKHSPPITPTSDTQMPDEIHLVLMELTIQFALGVARADGPVTWTERELIQQHIRKRFSYNRALLNRAEGFLAQYETAAIDWDRCLASISTEGFYPSVRMQIWQNRPVSYLFR